MSKLLLDAQERAAALLAIGKWRMLFLSFSSLWMAWSTATNQIDMSQLGWFDWFQTLGGCFGNWSVMMAALLMTQGKAIAAGHVPGLEEVDDPSDEPPTVKTETLTTTTATPGEPAQPKVNP